jgi:hypothetical protein
MTLVPWTSARTGSANCRGTLIVPAVSAEYAAAPPSHSERPAKSTLRTAITRKTAASMGVRPVVSFMTFSLSIIVNITTIDTVVKTGGDSLSRPQRTTEF